MEFESIKSALWAVLKTVALGSTEDHACPGDDARLSDARTPTAHTHAQGDVTDLAAALAARALATDLATESAARSAGDVARFSGRQFSGGRSTLVASLERAGICRFGASELLTALAEGACVVADLGNLTLALTDVSGSAARVQVSVVLATGTLVVRTAAQVATLNIWQRLAVVVDAPVAGSIGASSVHVYIDSVAATLETVADYSGAPVATASAWSLGGDNAGASLLTGRVASWGVLNYALTPAQVADYIATKRLPHEGVGSMQMLTNGSFDTFTGTADNGVTDTFAGWTNYPGSGTPGIIEAVTEGTGVACQLTVGSQGVAYVAAQTKLPAGSRCRGSIRARGDGTNAGEWSVYSPSAAAFVNDIDGGGRITTGVTGTSWQTLTRTWDVPASITDAELRLYGKVGTTGAVCAFDDVQVTVFGNTFADLDLAAQPVCCRTAGGAVLLDSASGAEVWPTVRPERMTLATQAPMTADGYCWRTRSSTRRATSSVRFT
jgi:hypothetical protein